MGGVQTMSPSTSSLFGLRRYQPLPSQLSPGDGRNRRPLGLGMVKPFQRRGSAKVAFLLVITPGVSLEVVSGPIQVC